MLLLHPPHKLDDFDASLAVEVCRRFVGEDQLRLHGQGACDRYPLTLTPGQLPWPVPSKACQSDRGKKLLDSVPTPRAAVREP